ncbi:unnamed protein product [Mytilus coruscus]|uniref:Transposase Helix-turn-helix domain-containing protein n=1 Tax=Mytilus coruscus TaxID=42192 RepID=A0A6J8EIC0_MYTCO|nr:unnamed protein product [Mytilus coruscus]
MLKTISFDQTNGRELISRVIAILCNAFFEMSVRRRMLLKPDIDRRLNNQSEPVGENSLYAMNAGNSVRLRNYIFRDDTIIITSTTTMSITTDSPEVFRRRVRINPTTFNRLVEELRGFTRDFRSIKLEKPVLIFIKYISSQMTLQAIADIFGVCEYSVFEIVRDLSDVICQKLLPK